MKGKRFLTLTLCAAMVAGSSLTAFAADKEGAQQGSGELQYVSTDDVFDVVLPTDGGTTFDYLLDPSGLIAETSGARYSGKVFEDDETVYFLHASKVDGTVNTTPGTGNCDYTATSDEIKVTNKSTQAVDLTVNAKIAAADGVVMTTTEDNGTFEEGNLYMAIITQNDVAGAETTALTTEGVKIDASIAADDAAYEITWNGATSQYERALTEAAKAGDYGGFKSYTFKLTGKCKADDEALLALKDNPPAIDLTWSVKDFTIKDAAPSIATTSYTYDRASDLSITVSLGGGTLAATEVKSVETGTTSDGAFTAAAKGTAWDYSAGTLTFKSGQYAKAAAGDKRYMKVIFDDTASTSVVIELTLQ